MEHVSKPCVKVTRAADSGIVGQRFQERGSPAACQWWSTESVCKQKNNNFTGRNLVLIKTMQVIK